MEVDCRSCHCSLASAQRPNVILYTILSQKCHALDKHPPQTQHSCQCEGRRTVCLLNPATTCQAASGVLVKTVAFMRNLPSFGLLPHQDQLLLMEAGWAPLFLLGLAQERVDFEVTETWAPSMLKKILMDGRGPEPESEQTQPTMIGVQRLQSCLQKFWSLDLSAKEYAYLKGAVLFNPDSCTFAYKTKKQLQSKQAESEVFTQLDLKRLPELNPPSLMPQGNVGTPTKVFLQLIQACRLPPRLIKKLQLQFPQTGMSRRYSRVPFEYQDSELVELEDRVYTASGEEIPRGLKSTDCDQGHDTSLLDETSLQSGGEQSRAWEPVPDASLIETAVHSDKEKSDAGEDSHSDDDNDTCEEWERHEALHEDVTNQERTEERLFEEKIELKWEKGGSGLVFYTDAQYWKAEEGDFDEQTADDWDVDMSIYYDQEAGDKDARDSVRMRLEQQRRDGLNYSLGSGKQVGAFEQYTKGFGRKVMEEQGWMEGLGLGSRGCGIQAALDNEGQNPRCKRGFGYHGEKLQTFRAAKKPRSDQGVFISTVYDQPREVDGGDVLLRRQAPISMKYRPGRPIHGPP